VARETGGSTIPNTGEMHLTVIVEQPANSAAVDPVVRAVPGDQVAQAVLVVSAGRVVLVGLANQVVQVASEALVVSENLVAQGALGNRVAPVAPVALDQRDVRAAAQARSPQHDRAGVAAPIKLETAAYLQVQVRAVAASAVAAETLLAPAAAAVALA
jgi:hypothetical protein